MVTLGLLLSDRQPEAQVQTLRPFLRLAIMHWSLTQCGRLLEQMARNYATKASISGFSLHPL